jgi:hypothetical protein
MGLGLKTVDKIRKNSGIIKLCHPCSGASDGLLINKRQYWFCNLVKVFFTGKFTIGGKAGRIHLNDPEYSNYTI